MADDTAGKISPELKNVQSLLQQEQLREKEGGERKRQVSLRDDPRGVLKRHFPPRPASASSDCSTDLILGPRILFIEILAGGIEGEYQGERTNHQPMGPWTVGERKICVGGCDSVLFKVWLRILSCKITCRDRDTFRPSPAPLSPVYGSQ